MGQEYDPSHKDCLSCRIIGTTVCVGKAAHRRTRSHFYFCSFQVLLKTGAVLLTDVCSLHIRSLRQGSSAAIAYDLWAGAVVRPPAHRYVMGAFGAGFFAMGVYRAFM
jgi:hypothetical protein